MQEHFFSAWFLPCMIVVKNGILVVIGAHLGRLCRAVERRG
jgi:hypothetical protein